MKVEHYHYRSIDSTNAFAKKFASQWNKQALTVFSADEQTDGKGQFNRQWIMVKDKDLTASFVLFTKLNNPLITLLSQCTALAVIDLLNEYKVTNAKLKWPNDVFVNNKKICGILIETTPIEDYSCVIIGVGLNILSETKDWVTLNRPVTSLFMEIPSPPTPKQALSLLKEKILHSVPKFFEYGDPSLQSDYQKHLIHKKGDQITIGNVTGLFEGISKDGSIILKLQEGILKSFHSGQIN